MSDPGLYEWIALRRVHDGGVGKVADAYLDRGRPTPDYLADVFDRLIWTGWASLAEGDPPWALRRLCLTGPGATRYAELRERELSDAPPSAPCGQSGPTS